MKLGSLNIITKRPSRTKLKPQTQCYVGINKGGMYINSSAGKMMKLAKNTKVVFTTRHKRLMVGVPQDQERWPGFKVTVNKTTGHVAFPKEYREKFTMGKYDIVNVIKDEDRGITWYALGKQS